MALRKLLSKRLFDGYRVASKAATLQSTIPPNAAKTSLCREYFSPSDTSDKGFFRRFIHRRAINRPPEFLSVPVGEKLREKLNGFNISGDRLRPDEVAPPSDPIPGDPKLYGFSVEYVRKLLKISQIERLKARLREIPNSSILYSEFVQICVQESGHEDQGVELAKMLDLSGNVIVLGNIVFLHPEQVAKSMENTIFQSIATPGDPRKEQLEHMELQKAIIDKKARAQVQGELYCGLGFLLAQTIGFMRLTFWELSWDVMEPICFFVTSLHFALAYGFFLRTSIEPSFEGYFQRRFKTKQTKLMKIHNFDTEKYNQLRKVFYPNVGGGFPPAEHYKPSAPKMECY